MGGGLEDMLEVDDLVVELGQALVLGAGSVLDLNGCCGES